MNTYFTKKIYIYNLQISIQKDAQYHTPLGNCKVKQQGDMSTHLLK